MSADLLRRLIEAGTPAELVAEVAVTLAESQAAERMLEKRRENERLRKREQREREAAAHDVTGCHVTGRDMADNPSPDKSPPDPQKLTPTPHTHTGVAGARKADPFPRPEWADPQVWSDLLANRRKKSLANTASAHRKLMADIDRLVDDNWPPGRVLEAAVSRGWGAIYPGCKDDDDDRRSNTNRTSGSRMGGPPPDPTLAMLRAANVAIARRDLNH